MGPITQAYLLVNFHYDRDTGVFTQRSNGRVRRTNVGGYLATRIGGKRHYLHRLIWLYMMGRWPDGEMDHINGDTRDNRWCNLRICSRVQNTRNNRIRRSKTGYRGVERIGKSAYRARIRVPSGETNKRQYKELGVFATAEEASVAYQEAAAVLYGEFRRDGR